MSSGYTSNYPTSGEATSEQLRTEFASIQTAFEDTISRSNTGTGSNAMEADLDMAENDLINVGTVDAEYVRENGKSVRDIVAEYHPIFLQLEEVPLEELTKIVGYSSDSMKYFVVSNDVDTVTLQLIPNAKDGTVFVVRNRGYGNVQLVGYNGASINSPGTSTVATGGGTVACIYVGGGLWDVLGDVVTL